MSVDGRTAYDTAKGAAAGKSTAGRQHHATAGCRSSLGHTGCHAALRAAPDHGIADRTGPVVTPTGKATSSFDLPLIHTLGKAFYWQRMIDTGEVSNASELARSLQLDMGWACEVLRMTRLAPDIIRAILEGRQPRHLNLQAMRGRQGEVPLDWEERRGMSGFAVAGG